MADSQEPQIAKDEAVSAPAPPLTRPLSPPEFRNPQTQEMLRKAQQDFPNLKHMEAVQAEANKGPGYEAAVGEGGGAGAGLVQGVKNAVSEAVETVKKANSATRDMREKHC